MKIIILCGGRGERFIDSMPKPLNRVCGKMIGEWMVESIIKSLNPTELIWILNPILYVYNIEDEITRWTRGIKNTLIKLPFETRDQSESLELGLKQLLFEDSFLCLDNDNIYVDGLEEFNKLELNNTFNAAILVHKINNENTSENMNRYGYVKIVNDIIIDGKEKQIGWGENGVSHGYWFSSCKLCLKWLKLQKRKKCIEEKSLLNLIVKFTKYIKPIYTTQTFSIGSPKDCEEAEIKYKEIFGWSKSRIVVDLDNTLVTYPKKHGDYSTVQELHNISDWIRDKSEKGAQICINTARRMNSCNHNIGKTITSIGVETLKSIKDLNLKESEIQFGKPYGDVYIDDKAINPYDNNWKIMAGDWQDSNKENPINYLPVTRNVQISVKKIEHVIKTGSIKELQGQSNYYNFISKYTPSIQHLFPKCYENTMKDNNICLELEYIKGVPGSYLWCHNIFSKNEWKLCLNAFTEIHSIKSNEPILYEEIFDGYITKITKRQEQYAQFTKFDKDFKLWNLLKKNIPKKEYTEIVCIHGDAWLGNVIFPMNSKGQNIKFIDMKGELNGKLNIFGDKNYDYAKLITSLLGMDSIVYNLPQRTLKDGMYWITKLKNWQYLVSLALILMYGAIWTYDDDKASKIIKRIEEVIEYIRIY